MNREIAEVLRRGFLSALANWQVILVRLGETLAFVGITVVAVIALIVPLLVSAGLREWRIPEGRSPQDAVAQILVEHAALFTYLLLFILFIGAVMIAVHAFVTAGATRVFVDAERAAPAGAEIKREQFAAFTMERWFAGARAAWLRVFWIYNGTWGLFGLILLIPVTILGVLTTMAALNDNVGVVVALSCGGFAIILLLTLPLGLVTGMWTQKAVVVCLTRDTTAREALRSGWREARGDFLRHFVVYFLIFAASIGASALLSSAFAPFSMMGMRGGDLTALFTGPPQVASMAAQTAIGNAIGSWMIAAFAAMTGHR